MAYRTRLGSRAHPAPVLKGVLILLVMSLTAARDARAGAVRPHGSWRTTESEHFRIAYREGTGQLVPPILRAAETAWDSLAHQMAAPAGRIDLVLDDAIDDSNGFAGPFPGNHVIVLATPPVSEVSLAGYGDWWRVLLTHELTHIFTLDRAGRAGRALRTLLGRVPASWPLFPVIGSPGWTIEGIPVNYESQFTGFGRIYGTYFDMILRSAVLERRFDPIDRASNPSSLWPAGQRPYALGSKFIEQLTQSVDPQAGARITEATTTALLPPTLFFNRIGRRALGVTFEEAWDEWERELRSRCLAWAESLRTEGLTESEPLTGGYFLTYPRVSPDGRAVAYFHRDGRTPAGIYRLDLATGRRERLCHWNSEGTIAWLPGGGLLSSRLEAVSPYEERSELAWIDSQGRLRTRVTGQRLRDPDVSTRTGIAVANQIVPGGARLVLLDLERGRTLLQGEARLDEHWARPRFSPDGRTIAAERSLGGDHDVVLLDDSLRVRHRVTSDRALDLGPAFSPDGRWLLFSSDRDGVMNLYAADLQAGELPVYRVTRLLTGAYWPDVSPDGRWIYFCAYHADGFRLERMRFDPAAWSPAEAHRERHPRTGPAAEAVAGDARAPIRSRPYRPWRSLRPRYWLPTRIDGAEAGVSYGATTSGSDLLGRHAYQAWSAWNLDDRRAVGGLGWQWAGLGQPVFGVRWSRHWSGVSARYSDDVRRRALEREDNYSLTASVQRVRWASIGTLTFGLEGTRERRFALGRPGAYPRYDDDQKLGPVASLAYRRLRSSAYAISVEEGFGISLSGRRRADARASAARDLGFTEGTLTLSAYQPFTGFGFARHVLALRTAILARDGRLASWTDIGGVSQGALDLYVTSLGGGRFLPVRGFPIGTRSGTRGFSTSLEYRFPIARIERGRGLHPAYLHHLAGTLFVDGGDAWATGGQGGGPVRRTGSRWTCIDGRTLDPLVSVGGELVVATTVFFYLPVSLRFGLAQPVRGTEELAAAAYVALGS